MRYYFAKARVRITRASCSSSSDRRNSLMSTSRWRSSSSRFVIIRRYRDRSRSSVWPTAIVVCRRWNPSRSPWCRDDRVCRRRRACRWSTTPSFPSRPSRACSRRFGAYKLSVVGTLGCDGRLRRPPFPCSLRTHFQSCPCKWALRDRRARTKRNVPTFLFPPRRWVPRDVPFLTATRTYSIAVPCVSFRNGAWIAGNCHLRNAQVVPISRYRTRRSP